MQTRRPRFSLCMSAFRLEPGPWLVAASLILQSCAPDHRTDSAAVADRFFRQVAREFSPALYARIGAPSSAGGRGNAISLVVLDGGVPPPTATCGADLKAVLGRQVAMLAARTPIRLRLTSNVDEAAVIIATGDTIQESPMKDPPMEALMNAQEKTGATSRHSRNFGVPGYASPDFLEGVFSASSSRLVLGVLRVHWMAASRGAKSDECDFDFIARLARLYSLALDDDLRSEYWRAWGAARTRTGLNAYEVPNTGLEERLGIYFCAQFAGPSELPECSIQVLKLMTNTSR